MKSNKRSGIDKTEQCFCQSWYDGESDTVKDCTCGKCEAVISKKIDKTKLKEILECLVDEMYVYGKFVSRERAIDLINVIRSI